MKLTHSTIPSSLLRQEKLQLQLLQKSISLLLQRAGSGQKRSHLFDVRVIEVHPLAYLGLEEEGGVVLAIVAHHSHQVKLRLASPLLCHTVEQL